ncbi:hypothetical protein HUS74_19455 [Pandoraea nosoerga]|nr:hypothetical protein [Pandoraea nosoerga]
MRPAFSSAMISSVVANGIAGNAGAEFGKALFYAKPVSGSGRISCRGGLATSGNAVSGAVRIEGGRIAPPKCDVDIAIVGTF